MVLAIDFNNSVLAVGINGFNADSYGALGH
jgi:hypothetical protein